MWSITRRDGESLFHSSTLQALKPDSPESQRALTREAEVQAAERYHGAEPSRQSPSWFVERELREFLSCRVPARGFARFRCDECGHEILVAFSCKGRDFCPSCCGRRLADLAGHLTDRMLGGLPVRQWVLTLPRRLRYALAWDHELCRAVHGVFIRALLTESPRVLRRLQKVRRWSNGETREVFGGSSGARGSDGAGAPGRA